MPRALWSGSISFGLVNIPVKLYRATAAASGRSISFHQLHKACGTPLKHVRRCPNCEVDVPWEDVAKGYEVSKGRYAIVTEEELDELLPADDYAAIAIERFVDLGEVDPLYYDRAYYVGPEGSPRAYALLYKAMEESGRVAIARVTLRTRSHLALVRTHEKHLVLETMFFENELVAAHDVPGLPSGKLVDAKQEKMARELVDSLTGDWDPSEYRDEYAERAKKLVEKKVETGEVEAPAVPAAEEGGGKVVNLLDALKRSVERAHPPKRSRAHRGHRRRKSA